MPNLFLKHVQLKEHGSSLLFSKKIGNYDLVEIFRHSVTKNKFCYLYLPTMDLEKSFFIGFVPSLGTYFEHKETSQPVVSDKFLDQAKLSVMT